MKRTSLATASLAISLLAAPSWAEKYDHGCKTQATATTSATVNTGSHVISSEEVACFTFVEGDAATEFSPPFTIITDSALICFDSDTTSASIGAARVDILYFPHGAVPAASPLNQSIVMRAQTTALDGTHETSPALQNACVRVGPGVYMIDITAAPAALSEDTARVTIKGEDEAQGQ